MEGSQVQVSRPTEEGPFRSSLDRVENGLFRFLLAFSLGTLPRFPMTTGVRKAFFLAGRHLPLTPLSKWGVFAQLSRLFSFQPLPPFYNKWFFLFLFGDKIAARLSFRVRSGCWTVYSNSIYFHTLGLEMIDFTYAWTLLLR